MLYNILAEDLADLPIEMLLVRNLLEVPIDRLRWASMTTTGVITDT